MKLTKQVIVMRKDLNMRKGKMVAQGSHASMSFLTSRIRGGISVRLNDLPEQEQDWIKNAFTKVCVGVDSLEELVAIYHKALGAGLASALITDAGLTEFKAPTVTCCAIGPDFNERIDAVCSGLKLL